MALRPPRNPLAMTMPTESLVDSNGEVSASWFVFFDRLMQRTGGTHGTSTGALQAEVASLNAALAAEQSARVELETLVRDALRHLRITT